MTPAAEALARAIVIAVCLVAALVVLPFVDGESRSGVLGVIVVLVPAVIDATRVAVRDRGKREASHRAATSTGDVSTEEAHR